MDFNTFVLVTIALIVSTARHFYLVGYNKAYDELKEAGLFDKYSKKEELELEYLEDNDDT